MRLIKGKASYKIYIILRVFNLDKDTIDMRLFVDPKGIEDGGVGFHSRILFRHAIVSISA